MDKKGIKKIVLAYSGGLDTSIIIPWLKENYDDPEIIAVAGNVGQADELDGLEEKALKTGASKLIVADLVDEMVDEVIIPSLKMGAKYEKYLLGTAFARPIIGKKLAEIALAEGADAIAHGATGKGNDQVRFELAIKRWAPGMKIIAPWREWDIKSRDEEIDYAEAHNVPLKISRETNYSKDKNLWHLSHEGLDLEDPANEPQYEKEGFLESDLCEFLADDRSCKSCAEHISLILSSHLDRWNDDFFYHLICKVCNDQLACSCLESLFLKSLELISLSYVAADCDDLRIVVVLLEPWNDDGSVETS